LRFTVRIRCFDDTLFRRTGRAAVAARERPGHEVEFPEPGVTGSRLKRAH